MIDQELMEFLHHFDARINRRVMMYKPNSLKPSMLSAIHDSRIEPTTIAMDTQEGYELHISDKDLRRLIGMLQSKGYFHDEDYRLRLMEEELILENPELKRLHDEYKTLLYLMAEHFSS